MYQISDSETYEFNLPELRGKLTYGCSNGWLAVGDNNFGLSLINLMTRQQVDLPKPYNMIDNSWYDLSEEANCGPKIHETCRFLNDVLFFGGMLYAIDTGQNVVIVGFDGPNYSA